jgi:sugar-specific transcriptional regulator TrmB
MLSKNMYEKALTKAGLDEKQAKVYLACLELGDSKAPEIARHAEIKRTTTYGILDELITMGLVRYVSKGTSKVFKAQDPKTILSLLEDRKQKISQVLPELSDMFFTHHIRPKIHFFEGKEGLKKIYEDILECSSKKVQQIVKVKDHIEVLGDKFIQEYIKKRVARGITAYDLHPKSGDIYTNERGTENAKLKRYVRYLPPTVFYAAMIMIYDNKVAMVSTKEENFGFIIESKQFSGTLRAYFEFMWGLGSKDFE